MADPTADWKTYTNKKYRYTLQLPKKFVVHDFDTYDESGVENSNSVEILDIDRQIPQDVGKFMTIITRENNSDDIKSITKENSHKNQPYFNVPNKINSGVLDGIESYWYQYRGGAMDFLTGSQLVLKDNYKVILFKKNDTIYYIGFTDEPVFNQILSTFKFLD